MKAIGYLSPGSEDALSEFDLRVPLPRPRDLLVMVKAVSVNPVDTKMRRTVSPPPGESKILGYDASGMRRIATAAHMLTDVSRSEEKSS